MKLSINKLFPAVCAALFLGACSDSADTTPKQPVEKPAPVEEPAPAPAEPAKPAVQPAPVKKEPVRLPDFTAQQLAEELKKWDKKLATLTTDFVQNTSYDGVEVSRSEGKLFYDRAQNRLRLDTLSPAGDLEQTAVTDKKDIVILDENNQHVTTLSWADWQQGQPNQALFDFGNYTALLDRHTAEIQEQDGQTAVLKLTPKEGEEYILLLTLSKKDFFPQVITIHSELMVTRADLKNIRKNTTLATDVFGGFNK